MRINRMNFIRKIFQGKADEEVHSQFVRFSKGTFGNKAVINVKSNGRIKLNTTFEFATDLVLFVAELVKKLSVSGIVLSRQSNQSKESNQSNAELEKLFGKGKKKKALFSFSVARELSCEEIKRIAEAAYCMLLDCSAEGVSLRIKKKLVRPKSPRGNKPPKVDDKFCVLELDKKFQKQLHDEFLFDLPYEFKKVKIHHDYIITDIIMPKGERDFALIRLLAKRKGKIIRHVTVDGKEISSEKAFTA